MPDTALHLNVHGQPIVRRWLTLVTLCLAVLVAQVDTAVVNLAMRPIGEYFRANVSALQWVVEALVFVLVSPFSGALAARLGTRVQTAGGVVIIACGLFCIGLSVHAVSIVPAELGLILTGLGMGGATGPLMGAAIGAVGPARSGTASALINVARMTGATLGVAILGTLFAIAHGGPAGLRLAMVLGGLVQVICAAMAWTTTRGIPSLVP